MSVKEKESINKLTDSFLNSNTYIHHIFFLVDIRHEPTENDRAMYDWIASMDIPCTIIANKADKLSKKQVQDSIGIIRKRLFAKDDIVPFSSEHKIGVEDVLKIISSN